MVTAAPEVIRYLEEHRERFGLSGEIEFEEWNYTPPNRYDIRALKMGKKK